MEEFINKDIRYQKRIRNIFILAFLVGLIFMVSTYAWFIGMKVVNVYAYDIRIATMDSLYLSLDGVDWTDKVTINESNYFSPKNDGSIGDNYTQNVNKWNVLRPLSSGGIINRNTSTIGFYTVNSITATKGGYRILTKKVDNESVKSDYSNYIYKENENSGYIAFDLFIRNLSSAEYFADFNYAKEEPIFLTSDSFVRLKNPDTEYDAGFQNAIRIGFIYLGRMESKKEDYDALQRIACENEYHVDYETRYGNYGVYDSSNNNPVTVMCKDTVIWEPNYMEHTRDAYAYYSESCLFRTGSDSEFVYDTEKKFGKCAMPSEGATTDPYSGKMTTYAINSEINVGEVVDTYDGINGYKANTETGNKKLISTSTLNGSNMSDKELLTLAPNSDAKVRVYIWLEGQDIDAVDLTTLRDTLEISFGFGKKRDENETVYEGYVYTQIITHEGAKSGVAYYSKDTADVYSRVYPNVGDDVYGLYTLKEKSSY